MAYLPNAFVKRTYFDSGNLNYSVNIEINQLAAYVGDKVVLSAWWNIANASGNVVKRGQKKFEVPMNGRTTEDVVKAQNAAVHLLSEAIAEQLKQL